MGWAAVGTAIKVVGVALSAKSAYEGIKDGNLFQAVVGAVGAYYGMSSLAAGAAQSGAGGAVSEGAKQGASTAGASTIDKVAAEAASSAVSEGVKLGGKEALQTASSGLDQLASTAAENMSPAIGATSNTANLATTSGLANLGGEALKESGKAAADGAQSSIWERIDKGIKGTAQSIVGSGAGEEGRRGLLSQAIEFGNENPVVVQSGLNMVGGVMQGKAEEKLMDRQERLLNERRHRMGTPGDISQAASIQWSPEERRFVMTGA